MRTTIDFGIDLGTTNSAVAVLKGTETEIIKNNEDADITASVVWLDREGRLHVGRRAKERLESDPENAVAEFKLSMGSDATYRLKRGPQPLRPEDLSAEILKSLKADVKQRLGEDLQAAVITVPAAFDLAQSDATRRAADLAGITQSPLVQEPVAAALAYGFQKTDTRAFWLVYDLGGGTFDAAAVQVRDGGIQVINNGGDNHLGGKLIDWKIVEEVAVPILLAQYRLTDFRRGNPKWRPAFSRLKQAIEEAKIDLSKAASVNVLIDPLCTDEDGEQVVLDFNLQRADVERLAEPLILRSINICKQVLEQTKLAAKDVEKLLLVGGPTKMPVLRDMLVNASTGLGIPLEFTIDPLTVVARGAAIFAGSQQVKLDASGKREPPPRGVRQLELHYESIGPEEEFDVDGKVTGAAGLTGHTIEFVLTKSEWRSGKVALSKEGTFNTTLRGERGVQNIFEIHLLDGKAQRQPTWPDKLTYTMGAAFLGAPQPHSIGFEEGGNKTKVVIKRGTPLPARAKVVSRQATTVRRGDASQFMRIPLVEGESSIADGNDLIGTIEINGSQLSRDLRADAEVEITISIDESRILTATAYVALLDEHFEFKTDMTKRRKSAKDLKELAAKQMSRLGLLREQASTTGADSVQRDIQRFDEEGIEAEIEEAVDAARDDPEAQVRCAAHLAKLRQMLNEAEDKLQPTSERTELEKALSWAEDVINEHGSAQEQRRLAELKSEIGRAMQSQDALAIRQKRENLQDLARPVLHRQPEFWVNYLGYLTDRRAEMTDLQLADRYLAQGRRAIDTNDLEQLKAACLQLVSLLPLEKQASARGYGGTLQ